MLGPLQTTHAHAHSGPLRVWARKMLWPMIKVCVSHRADCVIQDKTESIICVIVRTGAILLHPQLQQNQKEKRIPSSKRRLQPTRSLELLCRGGFIVWSFLAPRFRLTNLCNVAGHLRAPCSAERNVCQTMQLDLQANRTRTVSQQQPRAW